MMAAPAPANPTRSRRDQTPASRWRPAIARARSLPRRADRALMLLARLLRATTSEALTNPSNCQLFNALGDAAAGRYFNSLRTCVTFSMRESCGCVVLRVVGETFGTARAITA